MPKFKTRARAIDMLGRQQIAGTQNAINEIFKNAHDAYARHARIDFFEDEGTLIIRDDGVGMTKEDFEEKWLVLGTESKTEANKEVQFRPRGMKKRPITGEKGIGRLAIALLGRQVLVMTRAVRDDGLHDLVTGLVHWGLFELPGLNLDEIDIPVRTVPNGDLPTTTDVEALKSSLKKCVTRLSQAHPELSARFDYIVSEVNAFQPDPIDLDRSLNEDRDYVLSLKGSGKGTHFISAPCNPILSIELSAEESSQDYGFRKQLLGFVDHVFGSKEGADITVSFQRWPAESLTGIELLDPLTFFTKEEIEKKSDHLFRGDIDAFGNFQGTVRVYQQQYTNVAIPSPDPSSPTACGPFEVAFGYLMGREKESLVTGEDFRDLSESSTELVAYMFTAMGFAYCLMAIFLLIG